MTKKDFKLVAQTLRIEMINAEGETIHAFDRLILRFCDMFLQDNERFNSEKFKEAVYKGKGI